MRKIYFKYFFKNNIYFRSPWQISRCRRHWWH